MAKKEIKCADCGKWTNGTLSHCQHCGNLVDYVLIDTAERNTRATIAEKERKNKETAFDKLLFRLSNSDNPFYRAIFHVLNLVWTVYMALVAFVIWFTAIFSG